MTKIDDSYYLSNQQSYRTPNPELGKDEFLKILMTQLQNQDPLDPMDDKDFIAQMATFSQLEQTMNMASAMNRLVESQSISPIVKYSHMIGKEVTYETINKDNQKEMVSSKVLSVSHKDGIALFELANDDIVKVEDIEKVSDIEARGNSDE